MAMKVQELMTREVVSCQMGDPCNAAVRIMWECDCGVVPVVREDGRLAGMITDRDICMACWMRDSPPSALAISSVMSSDVVFCSPSDTIESAERRMRERQIRRLPVVDGERKLVGILSLADIVRAAGKERGRQGELAPEQVTGTLADICQPRQGHTAQAPA